MNLEDADHQDYPDARLFGACSSPVPGEVAELAKSELLPAPLAGDNAAVGLVRVKRLEPSGLYGALLDDASKPKTRRARESDIRDFARWLKTSPEASCVTLIADGRGPANQLVAGYQSHMLERKLAAATINRRISTLSRAVALANKYDLIAWSITVEGLPVQTYRDTAGPGRSGWLRLYDQAKREARQSDQGKRDLAIVCLLYFCALRREEVVALDVADWNPETARLSIMGKGRYEKELVSPNHEATAAIEVWLDIRGREPGALFLSMDHAARSVLRSTRDGRLSGNAIYDLVRRLGKRAGIKVPVRPHGLRHQAATEMARRSNGNVLKIQKALRHRDPKTTQKYVDNLEDTAGEMSRLLSEE